MEEREREGEKVKEIYVKKSVRKQRMKKEENVVKRKL